VNRQPSEREPAFSVCIPLYNAAAIVGETIASILAQTCEDFEIVVVDDCSTDDSEAAVLRFGDDRIRFYRNQANLGYAGNVARCFELARGRYVYLMGNDDILAPIALERTRQAFELDPTVALVTRPYYWFESDQRARPVRFIPPLDAHATTIVDVDADERSFVAVLDSISQLSGLAYRRDALARDYHPECFTAHVYPFLEMWKQHRVAFLNEYVLAVRIVSSQTRTLANIYEPSPTLSWIWMFERVFAGRRWARQRRAGCAHLAAHVEGLVQIRCSAGFMPFAREAAILARRRPLNLISPKFLAYVLFLAALPRRTARRLVDRYKPLVTGAPRRRISLAGAGAPIAPPAAARAAAEPVRIPG
jgi:glycosyltransferase involved in cell wall biosynthesis